MKVLHVYREGNRAADRLVNRAVEQAGGMDIPEAPPLELRRILDEDVQGVAVPRLAFICLVLFFYSCICFLFGYASIASKK